MNIKIAIVYYWYTVWRIESLKSNKPITQCSQNLSISYKYSSSFNMKKTEKFIQIVNSRNFIIKYNMPAVISWHLFKDYFLLSPFNADVPWVRDELRSLRIVSQSGISREPASGEGIKNVSAQSCHILKCKGWMVSRSERWSRLSVTRTLLKRSFRCDVIARGLQLHAPASPIRSIVNFQIPFSSTVYPISLIYGTL